MRTTALALGVLGAVGAPALAQIREIPKPTPDRLGMMRDELERGVDVEDQTGAPLPLDLPLTTSDGRSAMLGDSFKDGSKPAIIVMVYYRCPVVCDVVLENLTQTMKDLDFTVGKDYRVVIVSFDPSETPEAARESKSQHVAAYGRAETPEDRASIEQGWQFHVAEASASRRLADALGFQYKLTANNEYSHPVAIFLATPDGRVSRTLYGFKQEPRDLRLALMEASEGKLVRTIRDFAINRCYMYDPANRTYTLQAVRVVQIGGVLLMLTVGTLVGGLLLAERARKRRALGVPQPAGTHHPGTKGVPGPA